MAQNEPTATAQIPSRRGDDTQQNTAKESKIDACGEDTLKELAERNREKRLRKEAERAARKAKRHKGTKHKTKDDDGSKDADERISSHSQERSSGLLVSPTPDETPRVRSEKKKKKRPKVSLVDDKVDAHPPIRTDVRTKKDSSNFSRKRRRRDQSP
jgi:hypothetical protein